MPRCYMVKTGNKHPTASLSPSILNSCESNELSDSSDFALEYAPLTNRADLPKSPNHLKEENSLNNIQFASDVGIPIFKSRSIEETEAANDLLSLSQSLPPLPPPSVIIRHTVPLEEDTFPSPSRRYKALSNDKEITSLSEGEHNNYNPHDNLDYPKLSNHENLEYSKDAIADQQCSILVNNNTNDKLTSFNESNLYKHRTNSNSVIIHNNNNNNNENDNTKIRYEHQFQDHQNNNRMLKRNTSSSRYYQNTSVVVQNRNPVIVENRNYAGNKDAEQKQHRNLEYIRDRSPIEQQIDGNRGKQIQSNEYEDQNDLRITEDFSKFKISRKRQDAGRQNGVIASSKTRNQSKLDSAKLDKEIDKFREITISPILPTTSKNTVLFVDIPDGRRRKLRGAKKIRNNDSNNNKAENENYVKKAENKPKKNTTLTSTREKTKFFKVADETFDDEQTDGLEMGGKRNKYECTLCGKCYATSSNLSRHKQTHRSLDSHSAKKCETCGKLYVSMPALSMHLLTHNLAFNCTICNKQFSRIWLLRGHLRSHTGEKPFGCAHCGKAFADRSNLRAHMQTHSMEKRFECPKCHKTFALKSYLNKHFEATCVNWENSPTDKTTDLKDFVKRNVETQTFDD